MQLSANNLDFVEYLSEQLIKSLYHNDFKFATCKQHVFKLKLDYNKANKNIKNIYVSVHSTFELFYWAKSIAQPR